MEYNQEYDVFVSYSHKDSNCVKELVDYIESTTGNKCWYNERDNDRCKTEWPQVLMLALKKSKKVLLYLTSNVAQNPEQVLNEISNASSEGKVIIPLILLPLKNIPDILKYFITKYEWISCDNMSDEDVKDLLRKRLLEDCNELRDQFWGTMKTKDYNRFVTEVLKRYYGQEFMMIINRHEFGIYCVPSISLSSVSSITGFDYLCDLEKSKLSGFDINEHQGYTKNKWYAEYSAIIEGKIRHPNRPGYMLDKIVVTPSGCFEKLRVHVGTYAENVYSTHILEYELFLAYKDYSDKDLDNPEVWAELRNSLCIRNKMHQDVLFNNDNLFKDKMRESLLSGIGRDSLLSVQMLVVIKSKRSKKYEVKIVQRSNQVAIKPGIYQFVPAGGFEILNDSDDDIYDDGELVDNFSPGCAVFREYLEELFNSPEFEGGGNGSIEERLLKDPRIIAIEDMLETGTASLHFLGSVLDLAGLRHELSFVLILHQDAYARIPLITNEECKKGMLKSIPVERFSQEHDIWSNIHGPSAAMWHLFQQTALYKSLVNANSTIPIG